MAMRPRLWAISGLAVELGKDRRTVAKALARVPPAGRLGGHDAWRLTDALKALEPRWGQSAGSLWDEAGLHPFEYGMMIVRNLVLYALPDQVAGAAAGCGLPMAETLELVGAVAGAVRDEAEALLGDREWEPLPADCVAPIDWPALARRAGEPGWRPPRYGAGWPEPGELERDQAWRSGVNA
jgi:hypothetical protein